MLQQSPVQDTLPQVLFIDNDLAPIPDAWQACCREDGFAVETASTAADAAANVAASCSTTIAVVPAEEITPELETTLVTLMGANPDLAIVLALSAPVEVPEHWRERLLVAHLSPQDPPFALLGWVRAAREVAMARKSAAVRRQCERDLVALTDQLNVERTTDEAVESILSTALCVVARTCDSYDGAPFSGALLLMNDEGELTVVASQGELAGYRQGQLPGALQADAMLAAEQRTIQGGERYVVFPLIRNDRTLGVLFLHGMPCAAGVPDALKVIISHAAVVLENVTLFDLAAIDTTTRMFTRSFILKRLYQAIKSSSRTGQDLTVLMMDLDRFKQVNDTYGHLVGDRVLRDIGMLLHNAIRDTDILGRYGGDEFIAVLPNTPINGGMEVAQRLYSSVASHKVIAGGAEIPLAISIGVGGIHQDEGDPKGYARLRSPHEYFQHAMEMVLSQADGLMYRAKHGRDPRIAAGLPLSWLSFHKQDRQANGDA
jgi:diguanylate cyclase (GGDEF)-like protein